MNESIRISHLFSSHDFTGRTFRREKVLWLALLPTATLSPSKLVKTFFLIAEKLSLRSIKYFIYGSKLNLIFHDTAFPFEFEFPSRPL